MTLQADDGGGAQGPGYQSYHHDHLAYRDTPVVVAPFPPLPAAPSCLFKPSAALALW